MNAISTLTHAGKGFCLCGCGERTRIAKKTRNSIGHRKGEPIPYVNGHNRRKPIRYVEEDRGYRTRCWVWQLGKTIWGYGNHSIDGRTKAAHRHAYEQRYGPLASDRHLDHKCRQRDCINPDHLEPTTLAENVQRGRLATLTPYGAWTIRYLAATTSLKRIDIAEMFGVSPATVFAVLRRQTWKNI